MDPALRRTPQARFPCRRRPRRARYRSGAQRRETTRPRGMRTRLRTWRRRLLQEKRDAGATSAMETRPRLELAAADDGDVVGDPAVVGNACSLRTLRNRR